MGNCFVPITIDEYEQEYKKKYSSKDVMFFEATTLDTARHNFAHRTHVKFRGNKFLFLIKILEKSPSQSTASIAIYVQNSSEVKDIPENYLVTFVKSIRIGTERRLVSIKPPIFTYLNYRIVQASIVYFDENRVVQVKPINVS